MLERVLVTKGPAIGLMLGGWLVHALLDLGARDREQEGRQTFRSEYWDGPGAAATTVGTVLALVLIGLVTPGDLLASVLGAGQGVGMLLPLSVGYNADSIIPKILAIGRRVLGNGNGGDQGEVGA